MPEAILDEPFSQLMDERGISYIAPVPLDAVADFYQKTLIGQGWQWVYSDVGKAWVGDGLTKVLAQEFRQDEHRLAVVAIDDFTFFNPEESPGALVMVAHDVSSGEIMFFLSSLMVAAASPIGPAEKDIEFSRRNFISELIKFDHPISWFPTRMQMMTFPTDIGENNINILQKRCANDNEACFVNFTLFNGGTQYQTPISIRVYSVDDNVTPEDFDVRRWAELTNTAENPLAAPENIEWPEDLTDASSLETIELKSVTLQDDTPALQRLYRWRQVKLSMPLVGSYTLFKRNDTIIEFHIDFTEEEWTTLGPGVQEAILSIEVVQ
jgi:hypothetical protein